jgi:hypothetical protein
MVRSHQPGGHPVLCEREVSHTCIDMIPGKATAPPMSEGGLIVFIKFA